MASTISHSEPGCGTCDKLKYTSSYTRRNHWRQVHQKTCLLKWAGGAERSSLTRAHDGKWYCPQCHVSFEGGPQAVQKHVAQGACQEIQKKAAVSKPVQYVGDRTMIVRGPGVNESRKKVRGPQPLKEEDDTDNQVVEMKLEVSSPSPEPKAEVIDLTGPDDLYMKDFQVTDVKGKSTKRRTLEIPQPPNSRPASPNYLVLNSTLGRQEDSTPSASRGSQSRWAQIQALAHLRHDAAAAPTIPASKHKPPRPCAPPPNNQASSSTHPATALSTVTAQRTTKYSLVESLSAGPAIQSPLRAFLESLGEPPEQLAPIFSRHGFVTDRRIDLLAETPPEGHWDALKDDIIKQGGLAGWLVVEAGLEERLQARSLRRRV